MGHLDLGIGIIGAAIGVTVGQRFQNLDRNAPFILAATSAVIFYLAAQVLFVFAIIFAAAFALRPVMSIVGPALSD